MADDWEGKMISVGIAVWLAVISAGANETQETGQWRLSGNEGNTVVAYDVASIYRSGSTVTVRSIFATEQSESVPRSSERYDYRISWSRFDYERGTGTELQVAYYSLDREEKVFDNPVPG